VSTSHLHAVEHDALLPTDIRTLEDSLPLLKGELDAARFFVTQCGERIRYCERAGGWLIWNGSTWALDDDGEIYRLAHESADRIADAASEIRDLDERKKALSFAIALRKHRAIENVVAIASTLDDVAIGDPERFDADQRLLNVENGILDLRTGSLAPHLPSRLMTQIVPVRYDPEARCDRWLQFLSEVFAGDAELIDFIRRAAGYSLTAETTEQCLFVAYGPGANGKSTFLDVLSRVCGTYCATSSSETFMQRKAEAPTNDLARLRGARVVLSVETGEDRRLDESFVKWTTGGDRVVARFLFREHFEFRPRFKLWLACNHRPLIRGSDAGIWRRIRLVPFAQTFAGDRCDRHLAEKLEAELPGILAWAVAGYTEWQDSGLGMAQAVRAATKSYKGDMDLFGQFLSDRCVRDDLRETTAGELYAVYRQWAESAGERPQSQRWLSLRLSERGFRSRKSNGIKYWARIGLRSDLQCS
jgi:putative DNA primase/helicase